jgi:CheY-like chemotaxis protein
MNESSLIRVLCIDDSNVPLLVYQSRFPGLGMEAEIFQDVLKAVDRAKVAPPQVFFIDDQMPEVDGLALCRILKKEDRLKEIPVVIKVSEESKAHLMAVIESGADDFLSANYDVEIVATKLKVVVEAARMRKKLLELERSRAVSAMITTYNHEMRNPLAIAKASIGSDFSSMGRDRYQRLKESLQRMEEIVSKTELLLKESSVNFEQYAGDTAMISLKKKE